MIIRSLSKHSQSTSKARRVVAVSVGGLLLLMTDLVSDQSEGRKKISDVVIGGAALSKFQAMMEAQGVANETARSLCSAHTEDYSALRRSEHQRELKSPADGQILIICLIDYQVTYIQDGCR